MPNFATPTGEKAVLNTDMEVVMYADPATTETLRSAIEAAAKRYGFSVMTEPRFYVLRLDGDNSGVSVVPF